MAGRTGTDLGRDEGAKTKKGNPLKARKFRFHALAAAVALLASTWTTGVTLAQGDPSADEGGPQNPGEQTTVIRYGPYDIEAAASTAHEDHVHTGSQIVSDVEKPCEDCYITSARPDLVNEDGETVGLDTGAMLHHINLLNTDEDRSDATCPDIDPLGQRFFGSGDERTFHHFPPGYGYQVDSGAWNLIWEGSNHSTEPLTVSFEVTFTWVPASEPGMTDVEPIWFDVDQCGDSLIDVPAGESSAEWTWNANRSGEMIVLGGHQHGNSMTGGGTHVTITNETTGDLLCDSVAGYGETSMYVDPHGTEWLSSMSVCGNSEEFESLGTVSEGDQVTITGYYDQIEATGNQMGIAVGFMTGAPASGDGDGNGGDGNGRDDAAGSAGGNPRPGAPAPPIPGTPGFTG